MFPEPGHVTCALNHMGVLFPGQARTITFVFTWPLSWAAAICGDLCYMSVSVATRWSFTETTQPEIRALHRFANQDFLRIHKFMVSYDHSYMYLHINPLTKALKMMITL